MNKVFWFVIFGLLTSFQVQAQGAAQVIARFATPPSVTKKDVVDNPAIFVNQQNLSESFVLCTNKSRTKGGIHIYDLQGKELRFLEEGRLNSIDIRYNVPFRGGKTDFVAVTQGLSFSLCK